MVNLHRRRILAAGVSLLGMRVTSAFATVPSNPDVIVIGAGAAGIAAARAVLQSGKTVAVLEARNRIGGRAWTETESLGIPFDHGASWLHNYATNPLARHVTAYGLVTHHSPRDVQLYRNARVDRGALRDIERAGENLEARAGSLPAAQADLSLAALAGSDVAMQRFVRAIAIGDLGEDPERVSVSDTFVIADGEDRLVEGGNGRLIERLGAGLPIRTGAVVERIHWREPGGGVRVEGTFGVMRAAKCIVTAPPVLMVNGTLRFVPELPAEFGAAFSALPMGLMLKVGYRLDRSFEDYPEYGMPAPSLELGKAALVHMDKAKPLAMVIMGGDHARSITAAGSSAVFADATAALREVFGADVERAIQGQVYTTWHADRYAMGSYAVAMPGVADARRIYERALGEHVFFAGDSAAGPMQMTLGGAWASGAATGATAAGSIR